MLVSAWVINSLADTYVNAMKLLETDFRIPSSYLQDMEDILTALEAGDGDQAVFALNRWIDNLQKEILVCLPDAIRQVYLNRVQ